MKRIIAIVLASLGVAELLLCVIAPFYFYHQTIAVKCLAAIGIIALILILNERIVPMYLGMITMTLCIAVVLLDQHMFVGALLGALAAILMFMLNTKGLPTWLVIVLSSGALYYSTIKVINQFSQYRAAREADWYGIPKIAESAEIMAVNYIGLLMINIGLVLSVIALCFSRSVRKEQRIKEEFEIKPVLQREDDWTCPCGRHNTVYTSTCVCGRSKRDKITKNPVANTWECACGRENPIYTFTCVCGKHKRDVVHIAE